MPSLMELNYKKKEMTHLSLFSRDHNERALICVQINLVVYRKSNQQIQYAVKWFSTEAYR